MEPGVPQGARPCPSRGQGRTRAEVGQWGGPGQAHRPPRSSPSRRWHCRNQGSPATAAGLAGRWPVGERSEPCPVAERGCPVEPQGSPVSGPVVLDVCGTQRGEGDHQEAALPRPGPEAGLAGAGRGVNSPSFPMLSPGLCPAADACALCPPGRNKGGGALGGGPALAERSGRDGPSQRMPRQPSASRLPKGGGPGRSPPRSGS